MTKSEVNDIMGVDRTDDTDIYTIMGYKSTKSVTNPYRTEILKAKDQLFEIWYYYTDIKRQDGAITDDELTPLVFCENKLIGWGNQFLNDNIRKYELRLR